MRNFVTIAGLCLLTSLGTGPVSAQPIFGGPPVFSDPGLQQCLEEMATATGWTDTTQVVELSCPSRQVVNTQGIEILTSLTVLDLSDNALADIVGLDSHTGLIKLYLSGNADIPLPVVNTVLGQNTGLTHLGLGDIGIDNLFSLLLYNSDPQVNAPYALVELDVSNTAISNIDRLVEFPGLTKLDLGSNGLLDVYGLDPQNPVLGQLLQLSVLDLSDNRLTGLPGLDLLTGLTELDVSGNAGIPLPVVNTVLGNNTGLIRLGLGDVAIADLYLLSLFNNDPQVNAPYNLVELDVGSTGISNIDRLVEFPNLTYLDVGNNQLSYITGPDPQNPVPGQLLQLKFLDLSNNAITDLPGLDLLTGLTELYLSGNAGIPLPVVNTVLGRNTGLTRLGLGDIEIGDLYVLALFDNNPQVNAPYNLVELNVSNTGIDTIDRLIEFPNLLKLDLSRNRLQQIVGPNPQSPVLGQLVRLSTLDLSDNALSDIDGVEILTGLTELYLSGNDGIPLPVVNTVLAQNTGLTHLGLGDIEIGNLFNLSIYNNDPQVNAPYALIELDVSNTGISNVDRLVEFPDLATLDIGGNRLLDVIGLDPQNPVLGQLLQLNVLDLSDNRLTELPGLELLTGLTELYLSGNAGIPLPVVDIVLGQNAGLTRLGLGNIAIGDLYLLSLFNSDPQVNAPYSLVELDLDNTGISNIDRLVEFPNLKRLDLGNNRLPDIAGTDPQNPVLGQLQQLAFLDLGNNALIDLPGLDLLTGLTGLYLSGNAGIPLPVVNTVLGNNTGLTYLGLGDIEIDDLFLLALYDSDPQVSAPYKLIELDVSNTGIDNIDRLVEFPGLVRLDLSDNRLTDLAGPVPTDPVIARLINLSILDVSRNRLTDLIGLDFHTGLTELYLSGNNGIPLPMVNIVLSQNTGLTHLGLGDIEIGNLYNLSIYNNDPQVNAPYDLVELDVSNSGISDVDRLVEYPNLTRLDLGGNGLLDVFGLDPQNPVLGQLLQLNVLDVSDNALTDLPGVDFLTELTELYLSGNAGIPLPQVYAVLAQNVGLTHLGLGDIAIGDLYLLPLYNGDPLVNGPYELVELDLDNTGISNIDRLIEFPNLTKLDLGNNLLADIAGPDPQNPVLGLLLQLQALDLSNNGIFSLPGLDLLTGLNRLYLSGNAGIPLVEVQTILGNNTGLTHLGLGDISISDLYNLPLHDAIAGGYYKLIELDVSNTGISKLNHLFDFPGLTRLDLSDNQIADLAGGNSQNPVLQNLTELAYLDVSGNVLTDLAGLDFLTGLVELCLSGNTGIPLPVVQTILANNTGLTHLGLGDIAIGDLYLLPLYNNDPQVNAPYALVELDLSNTGISNIDRLVEFPDLTILNLGDNQLADLVGPDPQNPVLVQLTGLRVLNLGNNALTGVNGLDMLVWLDELELSGNTEITCDDLAYLDTVLISTIINHPAVCVSPDGDINEDGQVNVADVLMGTRVLLGMITLTGSQLVHGDVAPLVTGVPSPDGLFSLGDLTVIQRKVLGVIGF